MNLNIKITGDSIEDLLKSIDKAKEFVEKGVSAAHYEVNPNGTCYFALSEDGTQPEDGDLNKKFIDAANLAIRAIDLNGKISDNEYREELEVSAVRALKAAIIKAEGK
jgi:hypothetical protein